MQYQEYILQNVERRPLKRFWLKKAHLDAESLGKAKNRWLTFYIMDRQAISWSNYPPDPELSMPHHWFLFGVSKNLNCPCCEGRMDEGHLALQNRCF